MAQAIVSFLAIIDPLGNIVVFHLFAGQLETRQKIIAALVSVGAAFLLLVGFCFGGQEVLEFLGISPESFQVAAGLLLLPPAYRLVMEGEPLHQQEGQQPQPMDFVLVPLATPLIAGPGALAATTSFSASSGQETTLAALSIVLLITLVAFLTADFLFRLVGVAVLRMLSRVVGILLFAIAVNFVLNGVRDFLDTASLALSVL